MARPNTQMKFNTKKQGGGIRFESSVDRVLWTTDQLKLATLRDVSRVIRRGVIIRLRGLPGLRKGKRASSAVQSWVRRREGDLQIGFGRKNQTGETWHGIAQELGTPSNLMGGRKTSRPQPRREILRTTVMENLGDIQKISEQYFGKLSEANPSVEEFGADILNGGENE